MALSWMRMVKAGFAVLGSGMGLALKREGEASSAAGRHGRHAKMTASKFTGGYR
jgi:hypothetical protein